MDSHFTLFLHSLQTEEKGWNTGLECTTQTGETFRELTQNPNEGVILVIWFFYLLQEKNLDMSILLIWKILLFFSAFLYQRTNVISGNIKISQVLGDFWQSYPWENLISQYIFDLKQTDFHFWLFAEKFPFWVAFVGARFTQLLITVFLSCVSSTNHINTSLWRFDFFCSCCFSSPSITLMLTPRWISPMVKASRASWNGK